MLRLALISTLTFSSIGAAVSAQSFNEAGYCTAMAEQANSKKEIQVPIAEKVLVNIYKRGEAGTTKPMFKALLTGAGDMKPYSDWLSKTCDGLTLKK